MKNQEINQGINQGMDKIEKMDLRIGSKINQSNLEWTITGIFLDEILIKNDREEIWINIDSLTI